jgi:hypothetical protein
MSARKEASDSKAAEGGRARRRWPWVIGGLLGLCVLVLLVGPLIAAPIVKGLLIDGVHESSDARASLDDLSISLGGHVRVTGFRIDDASGLNVAEVGLVDVQADVLGALTGVYQAVVTVDGLSVHARLDDQGEWNLVSLSRGKQQGNATRKADRESTSDEASGLPDLKLSLRVRDGTFSMHTPTGLTELRNLNLSLDLTDMEAPAPFHISGLVFGPSGPGGELSLDGSITLARDGRFDPAGVQAELDYILRDLTLAALQPVLAALIPLDEVAGVIEGTGHWTWASPLTLSGNSTLKTRDVRLAGPAVGLEPIVLPSAILTAEASVDMTGAGVQTITLDAGELLSLSYSGVTEVVGDEQRIEGTLEVGGQLAGLLAAVREPLGIKPGVQLDGALQIRSDVHASWDSDGLGATGVEALISLTGLIAQDADALPIELGELTDLSFDLRATADFAAGTARLERLQLNAGPVSATAQVMVSGLPWSADTPGLSGLVLDDSSVSFDADLDRLQQSLGLVLQAGAPQLGGRIIARASARHDGTAMLTDVTLELDELVLRGSSGEWGADLGPLNLSLESQARLDLSPGGRTDLTRFSLRSSPLNLDASGSFTDLTDPELINGQVEQLIEVKPGPLADLLDGWLGAWFGGLDASGQPVTVKNTLRVQGASRDLRGRITMPELRVRAGGSADPSAEGMRVLGLQADFVLALGTAGEPDELSELSFAIERFEGAGLELSAMSANGRASMDWDSGLMSLHLEPRLAGPEMLALADGTRVGGAPFAGVLDLSIADETLGITGRLSGNRLEISMPAVTPDLPARRLVQQDVELELDLSANLAEGEDEFSIRTLRYGSQTARASLEGRLEQYSVPDQTLADLRFGLNAEIARLLSDAGALLPMEGTEARGALTLDGTLAGDAGSLKLAVDGQVKDLWLTVAPADGTTPIVVSDPRVELSLAADVLTGPLDVTLTASRLDSSFLQGSLTGEARNLRGWLEAADDPATPPAPTPVRLDADMTYDSQQLGALLAAWLPGRFSGEGRHPLALTITGDLASAEGLAALSGLTGNGQLNLAPFQLPGLLVSGDLGLKLDQGIAALDGTLALNGGSATLDADLDLRPEALAQSSRLDFVLTRLEATEEMGPMLASLHPLFAAGGDVDVGSVSGAVNAKLLLTWDGALPLTAADLAALPWDRLGGRGRIEFSNVTLKGSPLLGDMLGRLGEGEQQTIAIAPMSFELSGGRLHYAEPWPWKVSGTETNFTGSVGIDGSLALNWNVPITERLMKKHKFLRKLGGQMIEIPIRGSVAEPKMEWSKVFDDLAEKALKAELAEKLNEKLGGLGALGGLGGSGGSGASAKDLLASADALWAQGKQAEARPLYKELKDRHKLTLVYQLNKKRIKDRAKDP